LLNESERILAKTAGGLSLYDRLKRDPVLLDEMMDLLNDFKANGGPFPPMAPLNKGKRKGEGWRLGEDKDEEMIPV
jgi:hypothetical protein